MTFSPSPLPIAMRHIEPDTGENFTARLTRIPLLPSSSLPASSRCLPLSLARAAHRHKQSPGGLGHGSFWKLPRRREEGGGGERRGGGLTYSLTAVVPSPAPPGIPIPSRGAPLRREASSYRIDLVWGVLGV
uniref:Uncharacterized protein n=1 Tax=Oryza glumipatula TaxID=40148 RepID=A0A0D9YGJ9_9ORYZ